MESGKQKTCAGLALLAGLLVTSHGGRVTADSTDYVRGMQKLLGPAVITRTCHQPSSQPRDLVFETLDLADIDALPQHLSSGAHDLVEFAWNPQRGELSFSTTRDTVFSDLGDLSAADEPQHLICELR